MMFSLRALRPAVETFADTAKQAFTIGGVLRPAQ